MAELREMFKEIIPKTNLSLITTLNNLLDGSNDLDLKTHIVKPKQLASLISYANYLKTIGLTKTSKLIIDFVKDFLRKMVSYKRLSRTEIIKAISNLQETKDDLTNTKMLNT